MSNVYVHADYAVVGVMLTSNTKGDFQGAQVFVRKTPFADYTTFAMSFSAFPEGDGSTSIEDFDVKARFVANVVPKITCKLSTASTVDVQYLTMNSNISSDIFTTSYQKTDQSTNPRIKTSFAPWFV